MFSVLIGHLKPAYERKSIGSPKNGDAEIGSYFYSIKLGDLGIVERDIEILFNCQRLAIRGVLLRQTLDRIREAFRGHVVGAKPSSDLLRFAFLMLSYALCPALSEARVQKFFPKTLNSNFRWYCHHIIVVETDDMTFLDGFKGSLNVDGANVST